MQVDFRRLTVVSGLGICQLIAFGTSLYLLTTLSAAIVKDTGWSLNWVVGGYSIGVLFSAIISPFAGRYVGAGHGRSVLALSSVAFTAGLGAMAVSHHLAVYIFAWIVMGAAMGSGLYDAAFGTAGRLFGQTARASIIQIALWGGFAGTCFWPLSHLIESQFGWRTACLVFAGLHLVVCLPIYRFVVPQPADRTRASEVRKAAPVKPSATEWPIYLALGFVVTSEMAIVALMSVHLDTLLQSRGLSLTAAVGLSVFIGPSQVLARLIELTIGKRWPAYLSLVVGVVGVTIGVGMIGFTTGLNLPALVLYGAGLGVVSITAGTVPLALFGPERYPPLMGRLRRISLPMQALAPVLGAGLLSQWGAQSLLMAIFVVAVICLSVSVWLARASRRFLANL